VRLLALASSGMDLEEWTKLRELGSSAARTLPRDFDEFLRDSRLMRVSFSPERGSPEDLRSSENGLSGYPGENATL
jgi:hypothetical protein